MNTFVTLTLYLINVNIHIYIIYGIKVGECGVIKEKKLYLDGFRLGIERALHRLHLALHRTAQLDTRLSAVLTQHPKRTRQVTGEVGVC